MSAAAAAIYQIDDFIIEQSPLPWNKCARFGNSKYVHENNNSENMQATPQMIYRYSVDVCCVLKYVAAMSNGMTAANLPTTENDLECVVRFASLVLEGNRQTL